MAWLGPSSISATALEPAPLLDIASKPVVRLPCEDTAREVAVLEGYAKRRINQISGGAATKTQLLQNLEAPLNLRGPNDLYSKVDNARVQVLEALRSAQDDDDKENATTVMAAAFCVSKFCLEARDAQLRATATLANDHFKKQPSVVDEFAAARLKEYEKMIRNLESTLNKTLLMLKTKDKNAALAACAVERGAAEIVKLHSDLELKGAEIDKLKAEKCIVELELKALKDALAMPPPSTPPSVNSIPIPEYAAEFAAWAVSVVDEMYEEEQMSCTPIEVTAEEMEAYVDALIA
jgi:ribosome-binding protein aMBF1 (putative translation factor)